MDQKSVLQDYYGTDLPTSKLAIFSLITSLLGFFFPLIFSIAAISTGYAAHKETRSVPPKAAGDGLATAGIVMGWFQVGTGLAAFLCLWVLYAFAVNGWDWRPGP